MIETWQEIDAGLRSARVFLDLLRREDELAILFLERAGDLHLGRLVFLGPQKPIFEWAALATSSCTT
jgi:hypothetical protein